MSTSSVNVTLPIPIGRQEEVWGMDNQDFHNGSNALVHVVKRSGIHPEANLML